MEIPENFALIAFPLPLGHFLYPWGAINKIKIHNKNSVKLACKAALQILMFFLHRRDKNLSC